MIFSSIAEVVSIGAVYPFLKALASPSFISKNQYLHFVFNFIGVTSKESVTFFLTLIFCIIVLIAGFIRILLLWSQTRLSHAIGAEFSLNLYRRTLYQPYEIQVRRNSSDIIEAITGKTAMVVNAAILPASNIIISFLMLSMVLVLLLSINPTVVLISIIVFGSFYILIMIFYKKKISEDSLEMSKKSVEVRKALQEGLGGIRDVLLDSTQELFCDVYAKSDQPLRKAQANIAIIGGSPRFLIEAIGMILIACLAYSLSSTSNGFNLDKSLPIIGLLALGAQRMLPIIQQLYGSWASIKGGEASLRDALNLIDTQPLPDFINESTKIVFDNTIELRNLSFSYLENSPNIIENINIQISKGNRIGIIGETGSGKSTLLDIIMGLLNPTSGKIIIDGVEINSSNYRSWQKHIAHVPQSIFLSDSSVAENIAFGIPKSLIDINKVKESASKAQIANTIEQMENGYMTSVGERGVRLSGGQRQRIGIARALYKNADVIVFDEATSALDGATENFVMDEIEKLSENLTIIIVAHRLSTLKKCDMIIEINNKGIRKIGNYDQMKS
jgi:ABC-type multidrug transport system fused ATPase/permease subunit